MFHPGMFLVLNFHLMAPVGHWGVPGSHFYIRTVSHALVHIIRVMEEKPEWKQTTVLTNLSWKYLTFADFTKTYTVGTHCSGTWPVMRLNVHWRHGKPPIASRSRPNLNKVNFTHKNVAKYLEKNTVDGLLFSCLGGIFP